MKVDEAMLEADEQARIDALDVSRSLIVQAPAGSGKTELLIQRYLCLLATVAEPEEVVAITFTRKAATEMQLRVVDALDRARAGESGDKPHEQRTLQAAAAILARDRARDWRLLETPRRMRILTLDAYCASITRLLPVSSGLGGSMTTSADAEMKRLYREAAAATLDWLINDDANAVAVARVLEHLDNIVGDYINYLANMLAKRDQWLGIIGAGGSGNLDAVRAALEDNIRLQVEAQLGLVRDRFQELGGEAERRLLQYAGSNLRERTGLEQALAGLRIDAWPPASADAVGEWRAMANLLLKKDGDLRASVNVNDGFPTGDNGEKAAFREWLATLQTVPGLAEQLGMVQALPDARYDDVQWQVMLALFEVLPLAVAELRRLFAERGVTDHVEVAQAAGIALGSSEEPGELAMLLDYRIRHLLVDEMQDTSIGQYRLLTQLTAGWEAGDGRTLFCVGDPMQSIYRFRDAEVGQFVAARHNGIGDVSLGSLVLRRNFRSGEHLVDWFNSTFSRILPPRDDIATGAIAYSPSVAVERHAGAGRVAIHPLIEASPEEEALASANAIASCLAEDEDGEVAVLVRSRSQLPQLLAELRRRDIACEAVEIDRLTDLPEIIELLALTRAFCHPGDRIAWLALLRAPWVGLSWSDLHALVRNDNRSTVLELAADEERLQALTKNGRDRLQHLLQTIDGYAAPHAVRSLRERVECAWHALGGAACLHDAGQLENVYRYLDVLEKLELAGTLPDVAILEQQLDDERVSSLGDATTRVQVMTMHKAKGLQFDHIVLHGLGRTTGAGSRDVLAWLTTTGAAGENRMIISPLAPRASLDKDPLHRFIELSTKESDRLELDRLLYVACTRAIRSLHLVGSVTTRKQGSELGAPNRASLLHRLWPVVEDSFEAAFAALPQAGDDAEDDDEPVLAHPEARRIAAPWRPARMPSPPPLQAGADGPEVQEVQYDWVGSAARHAGTIVHRWLQQIADGRLTQATALERLPETTRRWAEALGVPVTERDAVVERVARSVAAVLADEQGRWLLEGEGHSELRLRGVHEGRVVGIAIDRVRVEGDVHWLVDYKTSSHEGGDLPGFLEQESNRYRDQLRRYRDLYAAWSGARVRTALYFPLLQKFVRVDVD